MSKNESKKPLSESALYEHTDTMFSDTVADSLTDEATEGDDFDVAEEKPAQTEDFMDDDENFLLAADEIIYSDPESIVVKQAEGLVNYSLEGLYDENGRVRNKYILRNSPPVLKIESNLGDSVEFVITKDLSKNLAKLLKDTHGAYYGIRPIEEQTFKEKLKSFGNYVSMHKLRFILASVFIVGIVLVAAIL